MLAPLVRPVAVLLLAGALSAQDATGRAPIPGPAARVRAAWLGTLARLLPPGLVPIPPQPGVRPPRGPKKISDATVALGLPAFAHFGNGVAAIGDLDGDGVTELAVGAPVDGGSVQICFLRADRTVSAHTRISMDGLDFGWAVCALGDLNQDGVEDIAVSNKESCHVFVLFLRADGTVASSRRISDSLPAPIYGGVLDSYGEGLAALGDVDGDGVTDLAVACGVGTDGDNPRLYLVFLRTDGTVKGFTETPLGVAGLSCADLGDLDGDGIHELALGEGPNAHLVDLFFFRSSGTLRAVKTIPGGGGFNGFGTGVAGVGDIDGNGVPDMAVGVPVTNHWRGGYTLVRLDAAGNELGRKFYDSPQGRIDLLHPDDRLGTSLAFLGNLDGVGEPELAFGAIGVDDGHSDAGAVWIADLR